VDRVIDGDSLIISGRECRLYGIDAPEYGQPHGKASRECLNFLEEERVRVHTVTASDDYGRAVVLVRAGEELVNARVVARGCAWVLGRYCNLPVCADLRRLEDRAREAGLGLWAEPDPMPPWLWRRIKRQGNRQ
jgi:endonuclease YncB( thermonuclease family)